MKCQGLAVAGAGRPDGSLQYCSHKLLVHGLGREVADRSLGVNRLEERHV